MILNEMKIMIIEDHKIDMCAMKNGLLKLRRKGIEQIIEDNIIEHPVNEEKDLYSIINEITESDPDILFVDLHLISDIQDGINILNALVDSHSELKYLPKYIISGADKVFQNHNLANIFQFAYPIKKPDLKKLDGSFEEQCDKLAKTYHQLFEATHQLNETLPIIAEMYRAIREKFDINRMLTNIEYKIDAGEITSDQAIKILQTQSSILKKIKITTDDIQERTKLIEIMSKSIAKALPKLATKANAKKLISAWEEDDDFKKAMGEYFPEKDDGLYKKLKSIVKDFSETATEDIGELLYNAGKEYLEKEVDKQDDDSKLVMLTKYSAYFIEKVSNFVFNQ